MSKRRTSLLGLAVLGLMLAVPARAGDAPPSKETAPDGQAEGKKTARETPVTPPSERPLTFTNEDLPARTPADWAHPDPDPVAAPTAARSGDGDDGERLEKGVSAAPSAAELSLELARLEQRLQQLGERQKSLQNPYLRGVTTAGDEEKEAVGGLANDKRLEWVQSEIAAAHAAIAEARAKQASASLP